MRNIGVTVLATAIGLACGFLWTQWSGRSGHVAAAPPARRVLYWVDPMHPSYKSDKPGIAPDCGMKLEPVYEDERGANEPGEMDGRIHVRPDVQQMIGVQYGAVGYTTLSSAIRAPGRVVPDETRLARVHPHMDGWIAKTFVDFNGQFVKKGDLLLTIYSPEVVAAEQEFLLALRGRDQMKSSPVKEAWGNSELLVQATRRRLEVFDLTPGQISEIEQRRAPLEGGTVSELFVQKIGGIATDTHSSGPLQTISVFSPASGFVTSRSAYPSQYVTSEKELYTLADLTEVWIMADVFEADLHCIREGQSALVSAGGDAPEFTARVAYIQPEVDPQTRTAKVRLEAANQELRLKPNMFVNVRFPLNEGRRLTVPVDAVIDSGIRQTVYVDCGEGCLEPRAVRVGQRAEDRVEILAGLRPGDRVVTAGTFLIDSESRLRAGVVNSAMAPEHP